jgi:hypothetical protein
MNEDIVRVEGFNNKVKEITMTTKLNIFLITKLNFPTNNKFNQKQVKNLIVGINEKHTQFSFFVLSIVLLGLMQGFVHYLALQTCLLIVPMVLTGTHLAQEECLYR